MFTLAAFVRNRFQVAYLIVILALCVGLTYWWLAPQSSAAEYKFMHCKTCNAEHGYVATFSNMKCFKCWPKKDGTYVPTVASVKSDWGGPWKKFSVAISIEIVVFMALLVYILRPETAAKYIRHLYCRCPKCKCRLRFRETSCGKPGKCPRCEKLFTFPDASIIDTVDQTNSEEDEPIATVH